MTSILLLNANSLQIPLADNSAHCVVTSPPYWGLRDYGIPGQLGLEPTPEEYIEHMVAVFREVKRVLRDDGTLWLNIGDSYAGSAQEWGHEKQYAGPKQITNRGSLNQKLTGDKIGFQRPPGYISSRQENGLKPKDLVGIPWRLAFALQADGWWLRSDIIWSKPNPMPESVTDRPTKAHEYLFLLAKSERYFYDQEAIREPIKKELVWEDRQEGWKSWDKPGRNRRTVWEIATASYAGAHFATYPPALVEPCIKAGTSARGVCPVCGAPWVRVVEETKEYSEWRQNRKRADFRRLDEAIIGGERIAAESPKNAPTAKTTIGWRPTCSHDAEPIPAVVFDPFAGSGTTLMVARQLGRRAIGLDLSYAYLHDQARARLELDALDAWQNGIPAQEDDWSSLPLLAEKDDRP